MNSDESFEAEVRATLEGLANEPAPDRLVSRVAAIPSQGTAAEASGGRVRPPFRNVISGFAAIAAVLALAVAAVVLRSGEVPEVGASSSATIAAPSSTPSHAPSSMPAVEVTPVPTALTSPAVVGEKVPTGFRPMSVTFVSADEGWVLGGAPCATGRCPVIAHTLDGGRKWTSIPAPNTKIGAAPLVDGRVDENATGIAGLRFANALSGWAFGPELWATHDGGATWKRLEVPPLLRVFALETASGTAHAVAYDGAQHFRIGSVAVGGDDWTVSAHQIPVGGGPIPAIQLVLSGAAGWVLENDRVVTAGARLVGGSWRAWQPVCTDVVGPAFMDASSPTNLVASCDVGQWSSPEGNHLFVSHDGGITFTATGPRTPIDMASAVATPSGSTILIGGSSGHGTGLVGSFDGGLTWSTVLSPGAFSLSDLGFTTASQGVVIQTEDAQSGGSKLFMTRDGGKAWAPVTF
jgi:hypothetical protein